jgi:DNA helicase HerA-like ATPase
MSSGEYYYQVVPTREEVQPEVVRHISSLYRMGVEDESEAKELIKSLLGIEEKIPRFEFLLLTGGKYAPVRILYRTNDDFMDALGRRLEAMYPNTFDIDLIDVERVEKLLQPSKFAPDNFTGRLTSGDLWVKPEINTTFDAVGTATVGSEQLQQRAEQPTLNEVDGIQVGVANRQPEANGNSSDRNQSDREAPPLQELDDSVLSEINPPSELETTAPVTGLDGPTRDGDGNILARPSLESGEPIVIHWNGRGERRNDWMTPMAMFTDILEETEDEGKSDAPLAPLIDFFANSEIPLAFQVVWERMPDWTKKAQKRKTKLLKDRDTVKGKIMQELGDMVHGTSKETRRERRRSHVDEVGEAATSSESRTGGRISKRSGLIDDKVPNRTFRANIRSVCIVTEQMDRQRVLNKMEELSSYLDHIEGYFYGLEPQIIQDGGGEASRFSSIPEDDSRKATEEFHRFLTGDIVSGGGRNRPDIILNGDELANFVVCPSAEDMTVEGSRGTRAEASTRDPLPRPDPDTMHQFHQDGLRLGYALDQSKEAEEEPTQLPPDLLKTHYARFGKSGVGKTKALINDILSLHENTDGPIVLIDPKGDDLADDLQKAFFQRYGEDTVKEDIIHFPCPEILPAMPFFDLRPGLESGARRVDVMQNKADHYDELLKFVMGKEQYEQSKVAPTIIKAVIKALFDEQYGDKQYEQTDIDDKSRESSEYFSHDDLESAMEEMSLYVEGENEEEGSMVATQDERTERALRRHMRSNPQDFAVIMNAVFNRLDYIREDIHLRRIFDNTERKFHFGDMMNDNKVIVFDLGDLRDEATKVMTGYLLTSLWDALEHHDNTICTQDHDSLKECKHYAQKQGGYPSNPPCREEWGEDHIVNLLIDESASAVTSDIMNKMLEQGRSFHLSVGLLMQNPDQMKEEGEQLYRNILNNISTILTANIKELDQDVARILSHENIDVEEFTNRIENLARGEWIVQLPAAKYFQSPPEPFSLKALPIPSGLDESENPLSEAENRYYKQKLVPQHLEGMQEQYGIERTEYEDHTTEGSTPSGGDGSDGNEIQTLSQKNTGEGAKEGQADSTQGEIAGGQKNKQKTRGQTEHQPQSQSETHAHEGVVPSGDSNTTTTTSEEQYTDGGATSSQSQQPTIAPETSVTPDDRARNDDGLPDRVKNKNQGWLCTKCNKTYKNPNKQEAINCCPPSKTEPEGGESETEGKDKENNGEQENNNTAGHSQQNATQTETGRADQQQSNGESTEQRSADQTTGDAPIRPNDATASSTHVPVPTTYDSSHINEAVTIDSPAAIANAINNWNPRTVFAICYLLYETFPPRLFEEQRQISKEFLRIARTKGAGDGHDADLTEDTLEKVIDNGFSPTPTNKVNVQELIQSVTQNGESGDKDTEGNASNPRAAERDQTHSEQENNPTEHTQSQEQKTSQSKHSHKQATDIAIEDLISTSSLPSHELKKSPLSELQLDFMATILDIMNNEAPISRATSLRRIRDEFERQGCDIDSLLEDGLVTEHRVGKGGTVTFTVEPAGRDHLSRNLIAERGVGDRGDGMPHRYGADITLAWLQQQPTITQTQSFIPIGGNNIADVVGITEQAGEERIAVTAEIEGGRSEREVNEFSDSGMKGSHDYNSLVKDYRFIEELSKRDHTVDDGHEALWVVRDTNAVFSLLSALHHRGILDYAPDTVRSEIRSGGVERINNTILDKEDLPGITIVHTFRSLELAMREGKVL